MKDLRINVNGKVYKTGYRYFVKQIAEKSGITGFIRYSGRVTVEIEAHGENEPLDHFLELCRLGCIGSVVQEMIISPCPPASFENFEII